LAGVFLGFARLRTRAAAAGLGLGRVAGCAIHFGGGRLPSFIKFFRGGTDGGNIFFLQRFLQGVGGAFDFFLVRGRNFAGVVLQHFFAAIDGVVAFVARFDFLALLLVFFGVGFGVLAHLFDLALGKAAAGRDGDLLLLARAQILGADVQNAVGVDVESHFNLRNTARCGRNVRKVELADGLVVARKLALA